MQTVANQISDGNKATPQAESINVIMGAYRIRGADWLDVIGMVVNGTGLIRDGNAFRLVHSEAFEQGARS